MLTIRKLAKSFAGTPLFEEVSLTLNYGEQVALVGPNETGKTTLFSLILGDDVADSGEIIRDEWTTVGYLPQEGEALVKKRFQIGHWPCWHDPHSGENSAATGRKRSMRGIEYYEAQAKFDALNDPQFDAKAKKMLHGLGFSEEQFEHPASDLSGGWVMRAHLARLLAMQPDLLMLDE